MITERDKAKIVKMYVIKMMTMHAIAEYYGVSGSMMRKWLLYWKVEPRSKSKALANKPPVSALTRKKMSLARKRLFANGYVPSNKGKKASVELCIKNMLGRMRSNLDFSSYTDYPRLKFLTYYLSKHKILLGSSDIEKSAFLEKFYADAQFNAIYDAWLASGKSKWVRPSLDHKMPKSRGGRTSLNNLQFLTWFENRAKAEMSEKEWVKLCKSTGTVSRLFIRR